MKVELELPEILDGENTSGYYWTLRLDGPSNIAPGYVGISFNPACTVMDPGYYICLEVGKDALGHTVRVMAADGWFPVCGHTLLWTVESAG